MIAATGRVATGSVATGRVAIAVLTYRRPDDLGELLPLLSEQVRAADLDAEVLVVDNDPDAGGRIVWERLALPGTRYVHEPTPGIAAARNRALHEASGHDVLIFIDDDERPGPGWLRLMLEAYSGSGRVGVVGPVVSTFDAALEPWVEAGRFFDRRRLGTGHLVTVAATNNLLLDLNRVRAAGLTFDERFGLSGGSDTPSPRRPAPGAG